MSSKESTIANSKLSLTRFESSCRYRSLPTNKSAFANGVRTGSGSDRVTAAIVELRSVPPAAAGVSLSAVSPKHIAESLRTTERFVRDHAPNINPESARADEMKLAHRFIGGIKPKPRESVQRTTEFIV